MLVFAALGLKPQILTVHWPKSPATSLTLNKQLHSSILNKENLALEHRKQVRDIPLGTPLKTLSTVIFQHKLNKAAAGLNCSEDGELRSNPGTELPELEPHHREHSTVNTQSLVKFFLKKTSRNHTTPPDAGEQGCTPPHQIWCRPNRDYSLKTPMADNWSRSNCQQILGNWLSGRPRLSCHHLRRAQPNQQGDPG